MNRQSLRAGKTFVCGAVFIMLACLRPTPAETQQKKGQIEQELVHTEFGFFEAWKSKDVSYLRQHVPENGVFWSDSGTLSREQELQEQQTAAKNCTVDGYSLSDFRIVPIAAGAYLLTYTAEQYATCGGEKEPVHLNGSSVYILKEGRWQAIYRAQVPLKNQT